jgi:hypothetical protein
VIKGVEREARMKWIQESLSMAFVREGPPLPPAPVLQPSLAIIFHQVEGDAAHLRSR